MHITSRSSALSRRRFSEEEYLTLERAADYKSDFCDGEIYAMAGAGEAHLLIAGNIGSFLHAQFTNRNCRTYMSDMRVRVAESGMYTYPDVVAVCGEARFVDALRDTLINPQLIVEVLSPSTMDYDRGVKLWRYRHIPSLSDYLLVSQDRVHVEHGSRDVSRPHVWSVEEYTGIEIASLQVEFGLADIYHKVDFTEPEPPTR